MTTSWTYEGYWNAVLGANRTAEDVVREFKLDASRRTEMEFWLDDAEAAAWAAGGNSGRVPEEWADFHDRALRELDGAFYGEAK